MPGGGRIPSLTIIFLYWRWSWSGCLSLATLLHFRIVRTATYSIVRISSLLLDLVLDEIPLQLVHLGLDLFLGFQQFGTVLSSDDRKVVLQTPMP